MSTALVQRTVSFYGDDLVVIRQGEIAYTPLKPICLAFGLDWEAQYKRVLRDEVLGSVAAMMEIPSPGGMQQTVCLPIEFLHGWLFGVQVSRVRPELRERVILYKRECYRILTQTFASKPQPKLLPAERVVDSIAAMVDLIREHFDLDMPWGKPPARSYSMGLDQIVDVLDRAGVLVGREKRRHDRADARRRYYNALVHEALMALNVAGGEFLRTRRIYLGIWPKGWE